jgi:hypothetical protein
MMNRNLAIFAICSHLSFLPGATAHQKDQSQQVLDNPERPSSVTPKEQNLEEYIKLLREDVRSQKFAVMREVMDLNPEEAAKFWPIYRDYDTELTKVNDLRITNIEQYARSYGQLTDEKADELIRRAMTYQQQRADLLGKYYDRMKQELGAVTAARFVQIEHQLLLIIDLQIASSLPVAGS